MRRIESRLRTIRESKVVQFSQAHLAFAAEMTQGNISLMERGLLLPTEEEAERIALALECTVQDLWPELAGARVP